MIGAGDAAWPPGGRAGRSSVEDDLDSVSVPVRVLVNAVAVRTGGGGTFVISQLSSLSRMPGVQLTVYARGTVADALVANPRLRVCRPPHDNLLARLVWENVVLARRCRSYDVAYCVGNFALPLSPTPQVVTMQNALHFGPAARRLRRRLPWPRRSRLVIEAWLARVSVRRASLVLAVSESLRTAIDDDCRRPSDVRALLSATPALPAVTSPHEGPPYVLSVANDLPHKDWDLIASLFGAEPDLPTLVAVGSFTPQRRHELSTRAGMDRVRFVGVVEDRAELAALYAGAACCIVHSHLEAFGLTALEALSAGAAVVASDIPAHREVCGDRAAFYDPTDMSALSRELRAALRAPAKVTDRDSAWSWEDNARELAGVLREVASRRLDDSAQPRDA